MPIILLKGSTSNREAITPLEAELVYDTDTGELFVGDGSTAGGNLINSHAHSIRTLAYNDSGAQLDIGDAVYISGYDSTNEIIEVSLADADNSSAMPAIGIVDANIANAAVGQIVVMGLIDGFDTSALTAGDALYVDTTPGVLTTTKPSYPAAIQKVGICLRSHVNFGAIGVIGAGRTNDVPALNEGFIFMGDSSGDSQQVQLPQAFQFELNGGGVEIATGVAMDITVPYTMNIQSWTVLADQTGSIVVDLWTDTYANFPPTVADTITGSEKPTISTAIKGQDLSLNSGNGWDLTEGDIMRVNVDSVTDIVRCLVSLNGVRL